MHAIKLLSLIVVVVFCESAAAHLVHSYLARTGVRAMSSTNVTTAVHWTAINCCRQCSLTADCLWTSYHPASQSCELTGMYGAAILQHEYGWDLHARADHCLRGQSSTVCYFMTTQPASWTYSQVLCSETYSGATLAKVNTHEIFGILSQMISTAVTNIGLQEGAWIGASRIGLDRLRWPDGSEVDTGSDLWWPDQPDYSGGNEECTEMRVEFYYKLNDDYCPRPSYAICQYQLF